MTRGCSSLFGSPPYRTMITWDRPTVIYYLIVRKPTLVLFVGIADAYEQGHLGLTTNMLSISWPPRN